jgi:hypothetical protein
MKHLIALNVGNSLWRVHQTMHSAQWMADLHFAKAMKGCGLADVSYLPDRQEALCAQDLTAANAPFLCIRAEGGCAYEYAEADLAQALCPDCGQRGHLGCARPNEELPAYKPSCFNCGQRGHTGEACRMVRPAPPSKPSAPP